MGYAVRLGVGNYKFTLPQTQQAVEAATVAQTTAQAAAVPVTPETPAAAAQPWQRNEIEIQSQLNPSLPGFNFATKHVVLCDLHGDMQALYENLLSAGLIDENWNWIGGNAILVQMGDFIDRGNESYEVDQKLRELQQKARVAGGNVVRLIGNHELMLYAGLLGNSNENDAQLAGWLENLLEGDLRQKLEGLKSGAGGIQAVREAINLATSGELSKWRQIFEHLRNEIASGDIQAAYEQSGVLFVHAWLNQSQVGGKTGGEIASVLNQALKNNDFSSEGEGSVLHNAVWNLSEQGVGQGVPFVQVVGHTPTRNTVQVREGSVINTDVGNSEYYGGQRGYAEFAGSMVKAFERKLSEAKAPAAEAQSQARSETEASQASSPPAQVLPDATEKESDVLALFSGQTLLTALEIFTALEQKAQSYADAVVLLRNLQQQGLIEQIEVQENGRPIKKYKISQKGHAEIARIKRALTTRRLGSELFRYGKKVKALGTLDAVREEYQNAKNALDDAVNKIERTGVG